MNLRQVIYKNAVKTATEHLRAELKTSKNGPFKLDSQGNTVSRKRFRNLVRMTARRIQKEELENA